MTMISKLNIVELSDVHLGHRTTPTYHIIESLNQLLPNNAEMKEVDLLIIAGDLFDRLLYLSHTDVSMIHRWVYSLLTLCKQNDIVLRVLEGTPSHDNQQPKIIDDINNESGIACDLRYVDTLEIEYIERFDINVLYIPDEYHPDSTQTLREVRELLVTHGLKQVDFAVMHGAFDYQIPDNLLTRVPHHDTKAYLGLVKYLIFIGHIHQYSQYKRIFAAGSTDRLRHGEEEKKGIIKVTVYESGHFDATFIVNKNAMVYATLDVKDLSLKDALAYITKRIADAPPDSHFRVKAGTDNEVINAIKSVKSHHPEYHWTTITQKQDECKTELLNKPATGMDNLHARTIPTLMDNRLQDMVEDETRVRAVNLLKEIINGHGTNPAANI